jgi:hypothetical protein
MFVGLLAVLVSQLNVNLRLIVLTLVVMMRRLKMVVGRSVMMCSGAAWTTPGAGVTNYTVAITIPEPSSIVLVALARAGLMAWGLRGR